MEYLKELLFCSVPERTHEVCHTWPAFMHQIHEDSGKSCLEVQRQVQGAASQGMPHARKLHLFTAGLELSRFAQCKKVPRASQAWLLVPASGQWAPRSRMYVPCELHLTGSDAMPTVFSFQLKLGRMEMQLLPPTSVRREGRELTLLCTFIPELHLKCFLSTLPLPQLNICIKPSKNLLLNLQDKIILKYLHLIQHWCREPEKVVWETFSFKYQYCKTSPPPSITKG